MSPSDPIREAGPADMPALHRALAALSADLGDSHQAGPAALAAACQGPRAFALALIAGHGPQGAALAAPVFSTTRGGAGAYVSDLWVAPERRGGGLGRALLAEVARIGARRWGAHFLKLSVYDRAAGARAFYARLGFRIQPGERPAILEGAPLAALTATERR
jgi:ribosomal protein S18 acetylase RimI-like enzyme